ncbi:MAG: hypothetical protein ACI4Q9_04910 [Candidatus Methanomethylophilaceae archaeon]
MKFEGFRRTSAGSQKDKEVGRIRFTVPIVTIAIVMMTFIIQPAFSISLESTSVLTDGVVEILPKQNGITEEVVSSNEDNGTATVTPSTPTDEEIENGADGAVDVLPPGDGESWTSSSSEKNIVLTIPSNVEYCLMITASSSKNNPNPVTITLNGSRVSYDQPVGSIDEPSVYYYYTEGTSVAMSSEIKWGTTGETLTVTIKAAGNVENISIRLLLKDSSSST